MPQDPGQQNPTLLSSITDPHPASTHDRPNDHVNTFSESANGQEPGNVTQLEELVETSFAAPLERNFIKPDGSARVRIITPGWGSSGYYSESMLTRDGPSVYTEATHDYIDHPTRTEEKERPERSLKDLAAIITGNVKFESEGVPIPGIYADIHVFKEFREFLNEKAPYIGMSHRAIGKGVPGTAEGKQGKIIESLHKCLSVDFVTKPGAGGGIMPMYEAYRKNGSHADNETLTENESPADPETIEETNEENMANEPKETVLTVESLRQTHPSLVKELKESVMQEIQASEATKTKEADHAKLLKESQDMKIELDRLREAQVIQEAGKIVAKALEKSTLPEITKARLIESVPKSARMKDGKLDEAAFTEAVTAAVKTETDYVAKLTESGKVKGMGGSSIGGSETLTESALKERTEMYIDLGMTKEAAEIAAKGRR
jgi:hypothetical protein